LTNVVAIAAGQDFSLALTSGGLVYGWGYNGYGQLGDGNTTNRSSPVQVAGLSGVAQIAAGIDHSLARKSDGTVWAWGYGQDGELGNGGTSSQVNVVNVALLTSATSIGAGDYHSMAVQSDGSVWTWGYNQYGQLGDGTTTNEDVPEKIGTLVTGFSGFAAVAGGGGIQSGIAGERHGMGLGLQRLRSVGNREYESEFETCRPIGVYSPSSSTLSAS
jgi:alpha-tubulin suppressor-like RCC1 family protein